MQKTLLCGLTVQLIMSAWIIKTCRNLNSADPDQAAPRRVSDHDDTVCHSV